MQLTFVSVDIETSGPSPSRHSLLAIGACLVNEPEHTFYAELRPDGIEVDPDSVAVSGLSLERLAREGADPGAAMGGFAAWVDAAALAPSRPVFVALNAPFDWMFVADYFHRYVGRNPFGHTALDVKALYMGVSGVTWDDATLRHMAGHFEISAELPHHALEDAVAQAEVFRRVLAEQAGRSME